MMCAPQFHRCKEHDILDIYCIGTLIFKENHLIQVHAAPARAAVATGRQARPRMGRDADGRLGLRAFEGSGEGIGRKCRSRLWRNGAKGGCEAR